MSDELSSMLCTLLYGGCTIAAGFLILLYLYQDRMMYFPAPPGAPRVPKDNPEGYRSPEDHGINFEDIYIKTPDGVQLHSWLLKQPNTKKAPTIIYFHGNAGNIGFRLPNAAMMFEKLKSNVLLVEYRGYGHSNGKPTEKGLVIDGQASLMMLLKRDDINPYSIFVFGRSLGGAVAISLIHNHPEKIVGGIIENTFLSIPNMVDALLPALKYMKLLILRIKWENDTLISSIRHPLLFISGEKDELVPPFHMKKLYQIAKASRMKTWVGIPNGKHNDTWVKGGNEYYRRIYNFINLVVNGDDEKYEDRKNEKNHYTLQSILDKPLEPSIFQQE